MAYFDQSFLGKTRFAPLAALRGVLDTPFDRRARRISARIAELRAMSDTALEQRGLTRADIVRYVLTEKGR